MNKVCEVYLATDDAHGVELSLPVSQYEMMDAFEQLRTEPAEDVYWQVDEFYHCDFLAPHLDARMSIFEFNALTEKLSKLGAWQETALAGLLQMQEQKHIQENSGVITAQELLTLAYNTDRCQVLVDVHTDEELGRFYVENGFRDDLDALPEGVYALLDYTRQDKLEADVLAAIQLQVKAALNYDKLLAKLRNSEGERSIRDQQNALITSLNLKLSGISKKRTRLYEDFTEGILDEEEYAFAKKAYDEQYVDLSRRLDEAVQRKVKFAEAMSEDNKWLTLMKSVSGATMLSHDLVDESVELVKVHEDGSIELVMKYGDIYALTVQSIKEVQEAM